MSARRVHLHRVLRSPPDKVYRAFLETEALAKWLPPYGFTCTVYHHQPQVGGSFKMCYLGWQESLVQLAALVEPDLQA
jgi:uncharacterized protein YndB with AHSA1/START domain